MGALSVAPAPRLRDNCQGGTDALLSQGKCQGKCARSETDEWISMAFTVGWESAIQDLLHQGEVL